MVEPLSFVFERTGDPTVRAGLAREISGLNIRISGNTGVVTMGNTPDADAFCSARNGTGFMHKISRGDRP